MPFTDVLTILVYGSKSPNYWRCPVDIYFLFVGVSESHWNIKIAMTFKWPWRTGMFESLNFWVDCAEMDELIQLVFRVVAVFNERYYKGSAFPWNLVCSPYTLTSFGFFTFLSDNGHCQKQCYSWSCWWQFDHMILISFMPLSVILKGHIYACHCVPISQNVLGMVLLFLRLVISEKGNVVFICRPNPRYACNQFTCFAWRVFCFPYVSVWRMLGVNHLIFSHKITEYFNWR